MRWVLVRRGVRTVLSPTLASHRRTCPLPPLVLLVASSPPPVEPSSRPLLCARPADTAPRGTRAPQIAMNKSRARAEPLSYSCTATCRLCGAAAGDCASHAALYTPGAAARGGAVERTVADSVASSRGGVRWTTSTCRPHGPAPRRPAQDAVGHITRQAAVWRRLGRHGDAGRRLLGKHDPEAARVDSAGHAQEHRHPRHAPLLLLAPADYRGERTCPHAASSPAHSRDGGDEAATRRPHDALTCALHCLSQLLSYALVLSDNHIYTSGATGTHAAAIRGALRAENPEMLTVILPQTVGRQPREIRELIGQVTRPPSPVPRAVGTRCMRHVTPAPHPLGATGRGAYYVLGAALAHAGAARDRAWA